MSEGTNLPVLVATAVESAFIWAKAEVLAPGAGFVTSTIASYFLRRHEAGKSILLSQLQRAGATEADFRDAEQFAAGALRYARAVRDQAADENLKLLAQAMIGLARQNALWASDFLKHAEILASLSRDEIILIGRMMAEDRRWNNLEEPPHNRPTVWHMVTTSELRGVFPSEDYILAIAGRAQRSGLILAKSGFGSLVFELSPLGRQLREVVDIENALS